MLFKCKIIRSMTSIKNYIKKAIPSNHGYHPNAHSNDFLAIFFCCLATICKLECSIITL